MRSLCFELRNSKYKLMQLIVSFTVPPTDELGCWNELCVNLSGGTSDQPPRLFASISQSFSGFDDPPGNRQAIPTTAIGMTSPQEYDGSECMLASSLSSGDLSRKSPFLRCGFVMIKGFLGILRGVTSGSHQSISSKILHLFSRMPPAGNTK